MKRVFAILLIALLCCGFIPQHKAMRQLTNKEISELYVDAIKALTIKGDTISATKALEAIIQQDPDHAPALHRLAHITKNDTLAAHYARKAYLSDTTNFYYLETYCGSLLRTDGYLEAIPAFKKLVKKSTEPKDFHVFAILLNVTKQTNEAIAVLDSAEVRFGRIPELGRLRQNYLINLGRILEAEADAKKSVEEAPYLVDNHITLARIYAATRRDSLAVVSYQNAIAIDTLDYRPWTLLAEHYNMRGDRASYLSLLPRIFAIESLPLKYKIEEWEQLITDRNSYRKFYYIYDTIIKQLYILHPGNRDVFVAYTNHLIISSQKEEALQLYKQFIQGSSATEVDFESLCWLENSLNRPDSVEHYLNIAAKRFPKNNSFGESAGLFAENRKEYDKALQLFGEALANTTDKEKRSHLYVHIGRVESKRDNMKACYKAFDNALKCSKGNDTLRSNVYATIGDIEHQRNNMKACYKAYDKSLKCFADNATVLNNYAYFLSLDNSDLERALKMIDRALELSENSSTLLDTKAWVLYSLGRYAEAKKVMQQALSLNRGSDPLYALHYGDILHALGEEFMAKTYWRKALEQGADKEEIEKRFLQKKDNSEK